MDIFNIAGWLGTFLIVLAYFLVSAGKVGGRSFSYQLINLFGAAGVFFNVFHQQAWPAVALQMAWGIIAIAGIVKSVKKT